MEFGIGMMLGKGLDIYLFSAVGEYWSLVGGLGLKFRLVFGG